MPRDTVSAPITSSSTRRGTESVVMGGSAAMRLGQDRRDLDDARGVVVAP